MYGLRSEHTASEPQDGLEVDLYRDVFVRICSVQPIIVGYGRPEDIVD
jgi:hypothetical protein